MCDDDVFIYHSDDMGFLEVDETFHKGRLGNYKNIGYVGISANLSGSTGICRTSFDCISNPADRRYRDAGKWMQKLNTKMKCGGKIMIITTTNSVEGKTIKEYRGVVFGEVISGVNFVRDIAASFSNFFGGRSGSYEEELIQARSNALGEMEKRAAALGANAVVGVDVDYEVLGADNGMLMVTVSGTAVYVE